jgi:hypothetical protein
MMDRVELEIAGCLRRLFRARYILRTRNESWFKAIIDHRKRLQDIVGALGAELEINEPLGVIYIREGLPEDEERLGLRLSRGSTLGPHASAMILHLRWHRLQFYLDPKGDLPLISGDELREFLLQFSKSKIDTQFERLFRRSLEELTELQVILETSSGSGFYEITSLCDLLLPADDIQAYRAKACAYFDHVAKESTDAG